MQKFKNTRGEGSVNWYPAHCVIELIVHQGTKATVDNKVYGPNGGYQNSGKYCIYNYYHAVTVSAA